MRALTPHDILALWERGARYHPLDRAALLCAWACPEWPSESIAERPLGQITTALVKLRELSFGTRIDSHVECQHCGVRLQLSLTTTDLLQPVASDQVECEVGGHRIRLPALSDLAAIADVVDATDAARRLLSRCTLNGIAPDECDQLLSSVEQALEDIDPNADLAFDVCCAVCGAHSTAQLDIGVLLWDEIDAHARALLTEIHLLASAYGWSESQILALSPTRRASYIAMVSA